MKKVVLLLVMGLLPYANANMNMQHGAKGMNSIKSHMLRHANPMPNLMRIAIGNAALLEINKTQMQKLMMWGKTNKPLMKSMIRELMQQEKALMQNALDSGIDLDKQVEGILTTRRNIMQMKISCRAHLSSVLTQKQFSNVVAIYKSMR